MRSKEHKDLKSQIQRKVSDDPDFREQLLANPKAAISKVWGIDVRPDINIVVHQNTSDTVHFVIPPPESDNLTDEELEAVAGGRLGAWSCACGPSIG